MPALQKFVHGRNPSDNHDPRGLPYAEPATFKKTRDAVEWNGNHVYDTDTEGFDATRASLDGQDDAASDASQDGEEYDGAYDDQADQDYYEDRHSKHANLDEMMLEMQRNKAHSAITNPESYPPTTSGEPDQSDESEDEVEPDHLQPQSRAKPPHGLHITQDSQRYVASTPLVIQTQPPRTQYTKDALKVQTKPTLLPRDVQHQKKSQTKTQGLPQPMTKHAPEHFATTAHAGKAAAIVPIHESGQARRQPAPAQITTADHRQKHVNGAGNHHQQHPKRADPQEQHLDNISPQQTNGFHQQQQESEDLPEDHHEQDTYPEGLDYDPEELYQKDFGELQKEPFDGAPLEENDTPSDLSSMPFDEKLKVFAGLDVLRQKELFSSLDIEQWEQAGDWFQTRFSEIMEKLKTARRKRRSLASEFEQKIAERQLALTRKRKITDDALAEMKRSGTLVLEGTPKKKQRVTE